MRTSNIAQAVKLSSHPVAVLKAESAPQDAICFKENQWGCVIAMLVGASNGKTAAFTKETTVCPGGRAGLGFCRIPESTKYFLSDGSQGPREGEFHKQTPELAQTYIEEMEMITPADCIVFKPFDMLEEHEHPEAIVFLVNADQLSALVTLANFDRPTQDNVRIEFGAGCVQSILYALQEQESGRGKCTIGITDPFARKVLPKELLSFSIPYNRFLEMEDHVKDSFLNKEPWHNLSTRIG